MSILILGIPSYISNLPWTSVLAIWIIASNLIHFDISLQCMFQWMGMVNVNAQIQKCLVCIGSMIATEAAYLWLDTTTKNAMQHGWFFHLGRYFAISQCPISIYTLNPPVFFLTQVLAIMIFGMQWIQTWGIHEHLLDVATWVSLTKLMYIQISKRDPQTLSICLPCRLEVKYFGRMAPLLFDPSNTRWTWVSMAHKAQNPGILPEWKKVNILCYIIPTCSYIHLFLCFAVKRCWASGAVYVKHCSTELRKHVFWPLIRPGPTRRAVFHLGCNRLRSKSGTRIAVLFLTAVFICSCFLTLAWPLGLNGCFVLLFPRWGRMSKRGGWIKRARWDWE